MQVLKKANISPLNKRSLPKKISTNSESDNILGPKNHTSKCQGNLNHLPTDQTPAEKSQHKSLPIMICGVSQQICEEAIRHHDWPAHLVDRLQDAEVIITIRNGLSQNQGLRREARSLKVPILVIKSNTLHQVERAFKRLLKRHQEISTNLTSSKDLCDEENVHAALEECRLAIEKAVVPLGQPIELLPRNMKVLQMQIDLVNRYRLRYDIFDDAYQKRIRVYPP